MKRCPICRRHGWFTDAAVADHIDRDHRHVIGRCAKRRYRTSAEALDVLIHANRRPSERRRERRRYQCERCGGWHLTSKAGAS